MVIRNRPLSRTVWLARQLHEYRRLLYDCVYDRVKEKDDAAKMKEDQMKQLLEYALTLRRRQPIPPHLCDVGSSL